MSILMSLCVLCLVEQLHLIQIPGQTMKMVMMMRPFFKIYFPENK